MYIVADTDSGSLVQSILAPVSQNLSMIVPSPLLIYFAIRIFLLYNSTVLLDKLRFAIFAWSSLTNGSFFISEF